ncbi:MAG: DUF4783 domain-containing protein [Taibaiella sp.]|nr:DUF4783 domain-containing protein [Taibaiella sp.]
MFTRFLLTISLVFACTFGYAQSGALDEMAGAVRAGKVSDILKYFDDVVPITMNNSQSPYSRTQAEMVLRDFFIRNPPTQFMVMNSGSPDNLNSFVIGKLSTPNGRFGVYILLKQKDNNYVIQEIRLNKE